MSSLITLFALAIVVGAVVALALLTFSTRTDAATLRSRCLESERAISELRTSLAQTSAAHVATELGALAGDVEALAASSKKQFGKLWAELHHAGVLERTREKQADVETPEQVRNRLRAANGLPTLGARKTPREEGE